jgi:hypothetical protein
MVANNMIYCCIRKGVVWIVIMESTEFDVSNQTLQLGASVGLDQIQYIELNLRSIESIESRESSVLRNIS